MVMQHCAVHSTQSVNTGGALAANKSARVMLVPPDTAGQGRVTYQRTSPHQAMTRTSHCTAAEMRARITGPSITHSLNKAWRTGGDDFCPSICGEPKMADFAANDSMELFHVGKFGIFGTRTHPFDGLGPCFGLVQITGSILLR